jgi:hypothetical protein
MTTAEPRITADELAAMGTVSVAGITDVPGLYDTEVPDEFGLTEAELADLLVERNVAQAEAIEAGHPAVWILTAGEEYGEPSTTLLYADRDLARDDFAAMAAALLDRWGETGFGKAVLGTDGSIYLQSHCDYVRLDEHLLTTQSQVTPRDGHSIDIAWAAIDNARPALPR